MIAFGFNSYQGRTYTLPSGWTQQFGDSTRNNTVFIAKKVAASDSGSYTFTANSGTDKCSVVILVYRDSDGIDLIGAVTKTFSSTGVASSISPAKKGTLIALFASEDAGGGSVATPPTGMTARTYASAANACIRTYDLAENSSGASGSKSLVWNASKELASILMQID